MANTMFFKGESNLAHQAIITAYPPIPAPAERGEWETVLGKEGDIWRGEGVGEQITVPVLIYVKPGADLPRIRKWLSGAGELRFGSWDWTMIARVSARIDFAPAPYNDGWTATVTFSVEPAWYVTGAIGSHIPLTSGATINNLGLVDAYPEIVVTGSGDIELTFGDRVMEIDNLDGSITIDSRSLISSAPVRPIDDLWPVLAYPSCAVSWTGTVTSVVLEPRWRLA